MSDIAFKVIAGNGYDDIIFKTIMIKGNTGTSIDRIEKTSTSGNVDTYTVYLTDGSTAGTFTVTNSDASSANQNISDVYDSTHNYVAGDLCIHENVLWRATANTTGTWDSTKWTPTTIDNVIGSLSSLTTSHQDNLVSAINELTTYIPVYNNTASGAIATFDTSLALPLQDLQIAINAVQESGTPTPSSPKAISGFTGANIHVADDETPHIIDNVTPITWQSEAGTVYGGSLDVTTGLLTVTHGYIDLGSINYTVRQYSGSNIGMQSSSTISGIKSPADNTKMPNAICEIATASAWNTAMVSGDSSGMFAISGGYLFIATTETVPADFKTAMNGFKLIYELATPVTYQLTPTQISAIVGTNNVFTDTNGDTSVVYACSLKDYIDSQ